jgi:hypothetical protein
MLLHALGWSINDSKNQEGVRVRFLGYILDSSVKEFQVPEDKLEKTQRLVSQLLIFLDRDDSLPAKKLESTLGSILSMRLAIPLVSVFTRDLYSPWKTPDFLITPGMTVSVTPQMRDELVMLGQLLSSSNGAPFMNAISEIDLFVDSSEIGWGASALGQTASGLFRSEIIGTSSTFRELYGLLQAILEPRMLPLLCNKIVRFTMDSKPAIANLVRGGGPVGALCFMVKQLWGVFLSHNINPLFRWFRRNSIEMEFVDKLSKSLTFSLSKDMARHLHLTLEREIFSVEYGQIPNLIQSILGFPRRCAIVIPKWQGKSWWTTIVQHCSSLFPLAPENIVFTASPGLPAPTWSFVVAVFD